MTMLKGVVMTYAGRRCTCRYCCRDRGEAFINCPWCHGYKVYTSQVTCHACNKIVNPVTPILKENPMPPTLTIDPERVKKAAADCPDAKRTLETLFPEVFEKTVDLSQLQYIATDSPSSRPAAGGSFFTGPSGRAAAGPNTSYLIAVRVGGKYRNKAFTLDNNFLWSILTDDVGALVLVPSRKDA